MAPSPAVIGRYALVGKLASGGMGTVYRARLSRKGGFVRDFALKRLHPHLAEDREAVSMLLDEARLAALVRHPNVVATFDLGKEDGGFYVVMELVEGASLAELADDEQSLSVSSRVSPRVAARIVLDVLEGLSAAHLAKDAQGCPLEIVHRDVSPANILVSRDGVVKLTDFGVAKARERLRTTVGVEVKGKIGYMPPEQLEGDAVDPRADLFAAGVVLWELLRGERLLLGNRARLKELEEEIEPAWFATGAGPAIDALIRCAIRRRPEERFASARAMAEALREAADAASGIAKADELASLVRAHQETRDETTRTGRLDRPAPKREATDIVSLDVAWGAPPAAREATAILDPPPARTSGRRSRRTAILAFAALAAVACACAAAAVATKRAVFAPRAEAHPPPPTVVDHELAASTPPALPPAASVGAESSTSAKTTRAETAPGSKSRPPVRKLRARPVVPESTSRAPEDPFGGRH